MSSKTEKMIEGIDERYIVEAAQAMLWHKKSYRRILRNALRSVAGIVLAIVLCTGGLTAAVAGGSLRAYDLLYTLYPEAAIKLTPVNRYCELQGIRMGVEAVHIDENKADVLISFQDMTGNRLNRMIDLTEGYSIHTTADQVGECTLVGFDEKTDSATFLIDVEQEKKITGEKIEISVSQIRTGKEDSLNGTDLIEGDWAVSVVLDEIKDIGQSIGLQGGVVQVSGARFTQDRQLLRMHFMFFGENADEACEICSGLGFLLENDRGQTLKTCDAPIKAGSTFAYDENGCKACDVEMEYTNPDFETGKVKLTPFTWDSDPESQKRIPGTDVLHKELSFTIDLDTIPKWAGDDKERLLREMGE